MMMSRSLRITPEFLHQSLCNRTLITILATVYDQSATSSEMDTIVKLEVRMPACSVQPN